ncbi:helix-turn-helix domain-containing protein [uncultured Amnibacterium sp.]|uniref:helix-turn-helix domain-containing protein n=1 Tax=uncultured Amnibacterium sp. TaxID=1631851 RepID=UPI0035CB7990
MSDPAEPSAGRNRAEGVEARLDLSQLGPLLREHRGNLSIRQAAADAGVSFSTFSRVEAGSQPDLTSFTLLCSWLGISPNQFFAPASEREQDPLEVAISHLSADPRLDGDKAKSIEEMLRTMYRALASAAPAKPLLAVHLRAASVMRPGVPGRLNDMLSAMHAELEARIASGKL